MQLTKWVQWTYMNIKGHGHSFTLVQDHSVSTFSSFFSLETAGPIEAKFHVEPPRDGERKLSCSNDQKGSHGHYMVKTLNIVFSGTKRPMTLKLGMQHRVLEYYQICSNDDPGLTLDLFYGKVKFGSLCFCMEKGKTMDFSETIVVYDIEVGRCSQPKEYLKLYEYQR